MVHKEVFYYGTVIRTGCTESSSSDQIMMDEKTMVSDTLTGINGELKMYAEYISQSEDPKLKQTLKQMRNKAEAAQEQIYQIAREKSYYVPAAPASKEEIEQVRSLFKPESML